MIDLGKLLKIDDKDGTPLPADEIDFIDLVVVLCRACDGQVDPTRGEECECGNTGFDWSDTVDLRATLRAFASTARPDEVGRLGSSGHLSVDRRAGTGQESSSG